MQQLKLSLFLLRKLHLLNFKFRDIL